VRNFFAFLAHSAFSTPFVFGAVLLVLPLGFSSAMADATTLRHRGSVGQPPAAAAPLDPVPAAADLSPTLSIKWRKLLLFATLCLTPYLLLLYLLDVERRMLKSILINLAMSVGAFFLTIFLIPIVSVYVLRRNMFGYDINKRGSPAGTVKV
jgi:UDP-N-acetylglucosamine--dolichyl-phosphate N-acetylglucosaminephosphotransferase